MNGRLAGQTHFWTLLSQTKFEVQVWTDGVTGAVGVTGETGATGAEGADEEGQGFTLSWQVFKSALHSNGPLQAIHSPLTL